MNLINLTPHAIVLQSSTGDRTTIEPSGTVARVLSFPGSVAWSPDMTGLPVPVCNPTSYGTVDGVPASREGGVYYIVSGMVLAALRRDFDDFCQRAGLPPEGHPLDYCVGPGTRPND